MRVFMLSAGAGAGAFALLSWGGCSSSTNDVAAAAESASEASFTPDDAGADAATDGGAAGDATTAPADHIGAIFAISDSTAKDGGVKGSYRAGASFTHVTRPDGTTQTRTVGPCVIELIGSGPAEEGTDQSAGAVHLTGGSKAIDLTADNANSYAPATGSTSLYNGGETLVVTADGKDVPAFTTSLTAPSAITLAAPAVTAGSLTVKRSTGVNATFSGASAGSVVLYFSATSSTMAFAATCTFAAVAGTVSVPAAAFADFPSGDGTFDFYVKESRVVRPSGWEVHFTASKAVVDPAGIALAGQATFE